METLKRIPIISGNIKTSIKIILFFFFISQSQITFAQRNEDPAITHIVDEIFGKGLAERVSGKRSPEKARYAELERQKRELVSGLNISEEIVPRDDRERDAFKLIELRRDRRLAEIDEQYARFKKEMLKKDLNDPVVIAYMEKRDAYFKEMRQRAINNFEEEIRREFKRGSSLSNEDEIRRRIRDIESEQRRLSEREIYKRNRTTSYYY